MNLIKEFLQAVVMAACFFGPVFLYLLFVMKP